MTFRKVVFLRGQRDSVGKQLTRPKMTLYTTAPQFTLRCCTHRFWCRNRGNGKAINNVQSPSRHRSVFLGSLSRSSATARFPGIEVSHETRHDDITDLTCKDFMARLVLTTHRISIRPRRCHYRKCEGSMPQPLAASKAS